MVKVKTDGFVFTLINVYAPNQGSEQEGLFKIVKEKLSDIDQVECIVLSGDWNCCTHFNIK